uniref:Coiled-coil domain-containing protein 89 n=1 Tax=Mesocestoides corti TaxID=53468 RepID=A0A5K3FEC4_MESCO
MKSRIPSEFPEDNAELSQCMNHSSQIHFFDNLFETSQLLLDERSSAKNCQQLYSHLKVAHEKLQNSYAELEARFTSSLREWLQEKNILSDQISKLSSEKDQFEALCVALQKNTLTAERLELIKNEIRNDCQKKSQKTFVKALKDADEARAECQKSKEELEIIRAELEQQRLRSEREQEKYALLHGSELKTMVEAHEDVVNRLSSLLGSDAETLAALYRLNTEMRAKCNCALDEARKSRLLYDTQLSELKNELIHVIDQLKRSNSENSTLKAKCDALTEQADMLKGSLARTQADLKTSRQKAIDCEQSKLNTEKHFEKLLQRSRTELSDYRVEFQRQRVDLEKQRDEMAFRVQGKC